MLWIRTDEYTESFLNAQRERRNDGGVWDGDYFCPTLNNKLNCQRNIVYKFSSSEKCCVWMWCCIQIAKSYRRKREKCVFDVGYRISHTAKPVPLWSARIHREQVTNTYNSNLNHFHHVTTSVVVSNTRIYTYSYSYENKHFGFGRDARKRKCEERKQTREKEKENNKSEPNGAVRTRKISRHLCEMAECVRCDSR